MHSHEAGSGLLFVSGFVVVVATALVAAYLTGVLVSARRGRPWAWWRTALWCAGIGVGAASVVAPFWVGGGSFREHVWAHLLAMAAPLLLVSAAPLTLALRSLHVTRARRLSRMLHSRPVAVIAHPVSAAVLSAGGLWLLYATPLLTVVHASPALSAATHAHLIAAGCLFAAVVIGPDPTPRPQPRLLVAGLIVATTAAHAILMKYVYAYPPAGMDAIDVREGAATMYYVGAYLEAAIIVVFCSRWYRAAGRRLTRQPQRAGGMMEV